MVFHKTIFPFIAIQKYLAVVIRVVHIYLSLYQNMANEYPCDKIKINYIIILYYSIMMKYEIVLLYLLPNLTPLELDKVFFLRFDGVCGADLFRLIDFLDGVFRAVIRPRETDRRKSNTSVFQTFGNK